jgi:hypothetical protein
MPIRSAPGRIRTCDTRFRKPLLYPLSYEGGARYFPWSGGYFDLPAGQSHDLRAALRPRGGRESFRPGPFEGLGEAVEVVGEQMTVSVQRHGGAGVAELRLDGLHVGAPGDQERRARVAQVVDPQVIGGPSAAPLSGESPPDSENKKVMR